VERAGDLNWQIIGTALLKPALVLRTATVLALVQVLHTMGGVFGKMKTS
jgi:hypothetical protein